MIDRPIRPVQARSMKAAAPSGSGRAGPRRTATKLAPGELDDLILNILHTAAEPLRMLLIIEKVQERRPDIRLKAIQNKVGDMVKAETVRAYRKDYPHRYALWGRTFEQATAQNLTVATADDWKPRRLIPYPVNAMSRVGKTGVAIVDTLEAHSDGLDNKALTRLIRDVFPDMTQSAVSQAVNRLVERNVVRAIGPKAKPTYTRWEDNPQKAPQSAPAVVLAPPLPPERSSDPLVIPPVASPPWPAPVSARPLSLDDLEIPTAPSVPPADAVTTRAVDTARELINTFRAPVVHDAPAQSVDDSPDEALAVFYDRNGNRWFQTSLTQLELAPLRKGAHLLEIPITSRNGIDFELVDLASIRRMEVGTDSGQHVATVTFDNGETVNYLGVEVEALLLAIRPAAADLASMNRLFTQEHAARLAADARALAAESRLRQFQDALGQRLDDLSMLAAPDREPPG